MKKTILIYLIIFTAMFGLYTIASAADIDSEFDSKVKETWISINGTATNLSPAQFILDYGKGKMTVEMDGWKWYTKNYQKMDGDKVTVYGRLGKTLLEGNVIDPTSIYDENLGKYFYGRSREEASEYRFNDDPIFDFWGKSKPVAVGGVTIQGTVTSVTGKLFTVNTGDKKLTVNTSAMPYDPLDKTGLKAIKKGDYLSVTGNLSDALTEKGELIADHIVILKEE